MKHFWHIFCFIFLLMMPIKMAHASGLIRDAEIENTLNNIMSPLTEVAPEASSQIELYIVADPNLNAFVQGGQNIFIHTGLLQKTKTAEQLAGVLAHELGHITGGHLLRSRDAMSEAMIKSLLTSAAVGVAAIASGSDGGSAIAGSLIAGNQAGMGSLTAFTRTQEAAADQAALTFLRKAGLVEKGLIEVMQMLSQDEIGASDYMRTHPLSRTRIDLLQNRYKNEIATETQDKAVKRKFSQYKYDRMRAKISGFLNNPQVTLKKYAHETNNVVRMIATSSALHKGGQGFKAYNQLSAFIKQHDKDAFLHDLAGQIALEIGNLDAAIMHYKKAYDYSNQIPLIGASYAQSLIATEDKDNMEQAVQVLKKALREEKYYIKGFRDLSVAYDRLGKEFYAASASAQYFKLIGNQNAAVKQATRALSGLPPTSAEYILVKDILFFSKQNQNLQ